MQVDFLTLACLRDHLDSILGARVQHVVLPDERSVALELYLGERQYLLASAAPEASRILMLAEPPRRGVESETSMLLLLRKWVRGARLVDVTQPAWERVLILHFSGRAGDCQLIVEIMGRYSNVILVGSDGTVLDAVKHVGPHMSRTRIILPGRTYQLPSPPPERQPITGLSIVGWKNKLAGANPEDQLHRWLVGQFLGIGKIAAQEIAVRVTGDPKAVLAQAAPQSMLTAVAELFAPLENGWWAPHVALDNDGDVIAFAAYEPRQFERIEPCGDINEALQRYFEAQGLADPYAGARQAVHNLINQVQTRLERRVNRLTRQGVDQAEVTNLRVAGELLLTYQAQVPRGASEVELMDYEGNSCSISLDSQKTAVENAQAYFRRYEKAHRAMEQIPNLIEELESAQAYLEQLRTDLMLAESRPEIDAVQDALVTAGWINKGRQRVAQVRGPRRFDLSGFPVFIGRNARQNEHVTFERGAPEDLWLHVRGLPGAHVIIKRGRRAVAEEVIQQAAELAAYYSRARESETQVGVDVTERRFVRRIKGEFPGLVTYRNERTLWVRTSEIPTPTDK
jgi:predicted ribosome quality control (RQC) complex YloA/Tae2 family protein